MKDPRVYLAQILESIERIQGFTKKGKEAFLGDRMVQDAVIRNFEVMGEAAKRVRHDFREAHPEIPWKSMAALRDVLIHDYEGVDLVKVWRVVEQELPGLQSAIASFLPPLKELENEIAREAEMRVKKKIKRRSRQP